MANITKTDEPLVTQTTLENGGYQSTEQAVVSVPHKTIVEASLPSEYLAVLQPSDKHAVCVSITVGHSDRSAKIRALNAYIQGKQQESVKTSNVISD